MSTHFISAERWREAVRPSGLAEFARKAVTTVGSTLLCAELLPTRNAAIRSVHLSDYRLAISTLGVAR